ncbi:helix-turn-helix domain-containing protein [Ensifer sp. LBL]|uniref:helix-turn-helix domain-containing protein n=1 Tax=Ensifer sp. LBL TaxID=2991056 RepID=UPI003D1F97BC
MTLDELIAMRKSWGWTQNTMANQLGMSLRAYQDIENERAALRPIHVLAVERVALAHAALTEQPDHAPSNVQDDALKLVELMRRW